MTVSAPAGARISLTSPLISEPPTSGGAPESTRFLAADAQWDRVLDDLLRLGGLENDWDGQGALALDPAHVDRASAWVREMRRWPYAVAPTNVLPGTSGEVILEWRGDSYHLAAEIATPGRVEWLLNVPGQPIKQWETDTHCSWMVRSER